MSLGYPSEACSCETQPSTFLANTCSTQLRSASENHAERCAEDLSVLFSMPPAKLAKLVTPVKNAIAKRNIMHSSSIHAQSGCVQRLRSCSTVCRRPLGSSLNAFNEAGEAGYPSETCKCETQLRASRVNPCSTRLRSAFEIMPNGVLKTSRFFPQCLQRSWRSWLPQRSMQLRNATSCIPRQSMLSAAAFSV